MAVALASESLERVVRAALAEDVGPGDVTTDALFDASTVGTAQLLVKEPGVLCGLDPAEAVFRALDANVEVEPLARDGDLVEPRAVALVRGRLRALLTGERTALNLLGRLSGVATLTRRYVDAVEGTGARILDTRKTTPGLRELEKYAVACGGGTNHRRGLYDAVLVKDNHVRLAGGLAVAVERLRAAAVGPPIQVEAETLADVREALAAGADSILLDNMPPEALRQAVALAGGRVPLEASGGITLDSVREVAATGVDFISIGALTHAARSLDVSMEVP
ncbi:MAG: carboxylating nicotinate-nucleotide diphosphorylase [Thermoleophilia bacterium]|nr:carboxylating nicotinate-nucleotide diphosphorylase [Thermoleophilia bacterium]